MFRFLMAGISILTSRIIKPTHKPKAKALADTYPSEFLHAIGRLKRCDAAAENARAL